MYEAQARRSLGIFSRRLTTRDGCFSLVKMATQIEPIIVCPYACSLWKHPDGKVLPRDYLQEA